MVGVTYTIPDAKFADFKAAFIKAYPVPILPTTGQPQFTENEWIKEAGIRFFKEIYQQGKRKIAEETAIPDEDVIS